LGGVSGSQSGVAFTGEVAILAAVVAIPVVPSGGGGAATFVAALTSASAAVFGVHESVHEQGEQ
jgi:hypothetical protein